MALPNPIVEGNVLQVPAIQSVDYAAGGETGWHIGRDGTADFNTLNLRGDIGAGIVSAESGIFSDISLPTYDSLVGTLDLLDPNSDTYPVAKGMIAYGRDQSGSPTITGYPFGTLAIRAHMIPGRTYKVCVRGRVQNIPTTDTLYVGLRYTTDNTIPTSGGNNLSDMIIPTASSGAFGFIDGCQNWEAGLEYDFWVGAFILRAAGAGALASQEITTSPNFFELWIEDIGLNQRTNTPVSYYASPSTPPAPVTRTYTKAYSATWSRTYDGDLTTTWDDSKYCYQGYYSSDRGNTRSLVGFDYAQIAADLSGATINSCKLTVRGAHAYYNSGYTLEWGTHNYTAKPGSWNSANVHENRGSLAGLAAGETATINLGTAIGGEFKSQTSRGISFGPGPSTSLTYYGYLYGYGLSNRPILTINYTK
jgi:hypothetical protein